jgi:hypothetical protein
VVTKAGLTVFELLRNSLALVRPFLLSGQVSDGHTVLHLLLGQSAPKATPLITPYDRSIHYDIVQYHYVIPYKRVYSSYKANPALQKGGLIRRELN